VNASDYGLFDGFKEVSYSCWEKVKESGDDKKVLEDDQDTNEMQVRR